MILRSREHGESQPRSLGWLLTGSSSSLGVARLAIVAGLFNLPQEIQLDCSPVDNATPSTDTSLDHNSAYQDMSGDITFCDDIYNAHALLCDVEAAECCAYGLRA